MSSQDKSVVLEEVSITSKKKFSSSTVNGGRTELYDEFVVSGERFSSDEEERGSLDGGKASKKKKKSSKKSSPNKVATVLTEENSMIVDGLHISDLSDNELFSKLNEYGVDVGPIVDSTRNIYRKKLAILMRGESNFNNSLSPAKAVEASGNSSQLNGKEEFSADEEALELSEDVHEEEPVVVETIPEVIIRKISRRSNASSVKKISRAATPRTTTTTTLTSPSSLTDMKTRISSSSNARPDRFTPTPRRGIHSYRGNEDDEALRYRYKVSQNSKALSNDADMDQTDMASSSSSAVKPQEMSICSKFLRILPYFFLFFVLVATGLYVYKNYGQKKEFTELLDGTIKWAQQTIDLIIEKIPSQPTITTTTTETTTSSPPPPAMKTDSSGKQ